MQQRMAKRKSKKRERGAFLTSLIVLSGLSLIFLMIQFWRLDDTVDFVFHLGTLSAIWKWQRWGVYLFFIWNAFDLVLIPHKVGLPIGLPPFPPAMSIEWTVKVVTYLVVIILSILWIWAIRRKWKYFE
jgi:hypothetical protein